MLVLQNYDEEKNQTVELMNSFFEGETYQGVVNLPFLQDLAENIANNYMEKNSVADNCGCWKETDYIAYLAWVECEGEKRASDAMIKAANAVRNREEIKGELLFVKVFGKMSVSDLYEAGECIREEFAGKEILFQAQHSEKWDNRYIAVAMLVSLTGMQ